MTALAKLGLRRDPFGRVPTPPVLAAHGELDCQIEERTPIVVLYGPAGSGKTFLLNWIKEDRRASGQSVRLMEGGDVPDESIDYVPELLLIDDADCVTEATIAELLHGHRKRPASIVLAVGTAPRGHLVGRDGIALVELKALTAAEARNFVKERARAAGRPDLFSSDALDVIAEASYGSQRLLRAIGRAAVYRAARDGAAQVQEDHAQDSIASKLIASRPQIAEAPRHGALEIICDTAAPEPIGYAPSDGQVMVALAASSAELSPYGVRDDEARPAERRRLPVKLTTALVLGAGLVTAMLLTSSAVEPRSEFSSLGRSVESDWTRVAQATLPPPTLLSVLNPAPLHAVSIAPEQAAPRPAKAATTLRPAQTSNPTRNASAARARQSPPPSAGLPKQIVPDALAVEALERTAEADNQPAQLSQPTPPAPATLQRYMTGEQMESALADLSARAGLDRNRERRAFAACVFRKVPPAAAPSVLFWTAATACLK